MRGMTLYLMDIASYQRGVDLVKVRAAGFTIANVKTSQGIGYTFTDAGMYARQARAAGMGVSLFHWLDGGSTGAAQAAAWWKVAKPIIADVGPVAMQIDCEDTKSPATWTILRGFAAAVADHLGHLPFIYTGDWWAQSGGRAGWDVHSLTPYLMAAPNNGYLPQYPGDSSPQWRAGYWGYTDLSLMQYTVGTIPGAGGGSISKTAIRDPAVWTALTGGGALMADDYGSFGRPPEVGDRTVPVMAADLWGGEALGHSPYIPAQKTYRTALLDRLDAGIAALNAKADTEAVRERAVQAALDAIAAAVGQAGGSIDAAPIVAAVRDTWTSAQARFDQLHGDLVTAQTRADRFAGVLASLGVDLSKLGNEPTT